MAKIFKLILISMIVLGLGTALVVSAQEDVTTEIEETIEEVVLDETVEPEDLDSEEPKILPNNPFYFVKEWGRAIQSFFAFGQIKKAELESNFANERLMELKKLTEQKKGAEIIKRATEKYKRAIEKVKTQSEKIKEKASENPKVESFLDKLTKHQLLHQKVLQKLEEQVPEEVFQKIKEAREMHLERFGQIMTKLEDKEEKIGERLENVLETIEGSKFKNFKSLEILKELEEKVPEEAKDAIRQAQENALKRLKDDLEKMSPEDQERFKEYVDKISGNKETQAKILERVKEKIQNRESLEEKLDAAREKVLERIRIKEREKEQFGSDNSGACILLWSPVCGKDGKTYSNDCFARQARVEIDYKGECK